MFALVEDEEELHSPSPARDERNREYQIHRVALGGNSAQEEMDTAVVYGLKRH